MTSNISFFSRFNEGGVFMYFILSFGLLTISFIAERAMALYRNVKAVPAGFREQVMSFVSRGDFQGAEAYVRSSAGETSLGRITAAGLKMRAQACGDDELQARMDDLLTAEISATDRRTGFLGMFGNVATLMGLLGTIIGMIHSFAAVASASPVDRATMLSKGISEAMNCTAFGLLVAIPALVAYAIFQNRTDKLVGALTEATSQIYHDLLFLTGWEGASKGISSKSQSNASASAPSARTQSAPSMTV